MISKIGSSIEFSDEVVAIIVENRSVSNIKNKLKLYIPTLMSGIKKGDPEISTISTNGKSVFANAKKCMPAISTNCPKEQNYLSGSISTNSSIDHLKVPVYDEETGEITNEYVKKGTKVRCKFLNGKISQLYFNTNE